MLLREVQRHGLALAENLAYNAEYSLLFRDVEVLDKLIDGVVLNRDVLFALIVDTEKEVVAEKALETFPKHQENVQDRVTEILTHSPNVPFTEHYENVYHIFIPVFIPTIETEGSETSGESPESGIQPITAQQREILGMTVVGISFKRVTESLKEIQKQVLQLALVILVLAVIVARILVNMISQPIEKLAIGTYRIARGDLNREVQVGFPREIGELAESFNRMIQELRSSRKELELWAKTLENRVQERTQEIEQKNARLTELIDTMKRIQEQLVHSEKMASLGQLVAGIAHEINNPVNFISSNISPLKNYISAMKRLIMEYEQRLNIYDDTQQGLEQLKSDLDFDFLIDDLDDLIQDVETGAIRIKRIVQDLRNFSRLDEAEMKTVDIHDSLNTTLNLLGHIYENRITVHKQYGYIPPVECYAGQLNQVFMNLLANAGQAIVRSGNVWITTWLEDQGAGVGRVAIAIRDDGAGVPEELLPKIFDPFFTTKDVGEGTGLGLSISYGIIEKHQGEITVESTPGEGTEFTLKIPLKLSVGPN